MSAQWEPVRYDLIGIFAYSIGGHGAEYVKHAIRPGKDTAILRVSRLQLC